MKSDKKLQIDSCDFIASLTYKITKEGGRATPAKSGYRPAVKFPFSEMMSSGAQIFLDGELVNPGETSNVAIKMLSADYFTGSLKAGMSFEVLEGNKLTATGMITEILN